MPTNGANQWKNFFQSRWFIFLAIIFIFMVIFSFARAYYRGYQVAREIARLESEVKRLEAKKIETIDYLQYVKSPNFVEDKARTELNLVHPGENLTIIDGADDAPSNTGQNSDKMVKFSKLSNPLKWWKFFTN